MSISAAANLGDPLSSGQIVFKDGTLMTTASVTGGRNMTVGIFGGTFNSNGFDSTFGALDGPSVLNTFTKSGIGKLTLTHVRTPTISIATGTLAIASGGGNAGTSKVTNLFIAGQLDLADSKLVAPTAAPGSAASTTLRTPVCPVSFNPAGTAGPGTAAASSPRCRLRC